MTPLPAVSVIPLRDGPAGLEAFVQHRADTMDFAAGAVVFPGGRLDPGDARTPLSLAAPRLAELTAALAAVSLVGRDDPEGDAATIVAAAVREVEEETGVRLRPDDLVPWDNWITPEAAPKRFDVVFFVVVADEREWANTTTEAVRAEWLGVAAILDGAARGELLLLPPTRVILTELRALGDVAAVLAARPLIAPVFDDRPQPRPRPPRD